LCPHGALFALSVDINALQGGAELCLRGNSLQVFLQALAIRINDLSALQADHVYMKIGSSLFRVGVIETKNPA